MLGLSEEGKSPYFSVVKSRVCIIILIVALFLVKIMPACCSSTYPTTHSLLTHSPTHSLPTPTHIPTPSFNPLLPPLSEIPPTSSPRASRLASQHHYPTIHPLRSPFTHLISLPFPFSAELLTEERKEGRKKRRKEERKKGRKEGRKEGREKEGTLICEKPTSPMGSATVPATKAKTVPHKRANERMNEQSLSLRRCGGVFVRYEK